MRRAGSSLLWLLGVSAATMLTPNAFAQSQLPPLPPVIPASQEVPIRPFAKPVVISEPESEPIGEGRAILRTQGTMYGRGKTQDQDVDFNIAIELPGQERLFQRFSETEVFKRIEESASTKAGAGRVFFPEYPPISKEPFKPRAFAPMVEVVEPLVLEHGRLFFEQPNFERQGWDLGFFTTAINLGVFYYDVAMFPYHYWTRPCGCCDSSAGKCLPGDPTPLYLYHEPLSITGLAGQAATVVGGVFIFP